ncbi:hypothetical protein ACWM35_22610 [Neobacillus sp. K501]
MNDNSKLETSEANIKLNKQLEDGKTHAPILGSEAEKANIELQEQFSADSEQKDLRTSPTAIVTPQ